MDKSVKMEEHQQAQQETVLVCAKKDLKGKIVGAVIFKNAMKINLSKTIVVWIVKKAILGK